MEIPTSFALPGRPLPRLHFYYASSLRRYHAEGHTNVLLTQWAASSESLKPPLPARECRYGVTFVGAAHGTRRKRVEELRAWGVEVQCFGHDWEGGAIKAEDIPRVMRESAISLNFANSSGENQIKARTFEVPALAASSSAKRQLGSNTGTRQAPKS